MSKGNHTEGILKVSVLSWIVRTVRINVYSLRVEMLWEGSDKLQRCSCVVMELEVLLLWQGHELKAIGIRGDVVNDVPSSANVTVSILCYCWGAFDVVS